MSDISKSAVRYRATVSRDPQAKPGLEWGYEAFRNELRFSTQSAFPCAADAERFLWQRIAKEIAERGDCAPSICIKTKGN